MGCGLLRELQFLKKITFGGVYMTDPVVPTFSGPQLTGGCLKCVTAELLPPKVAGLQAPNANQPVGGGDPDHGQWLAA